VDVVGPPMLRLMIRAPCETAYRIAADSASSVNAPLELPALTTRRRASPPYAAAIDATKVPCPFTSRTSDVPLRTSNVLTVRAPIWGTERSAPVSITAISTCAAACRTLAEMPASSIAPSCQPVPAAASAATRTAAAGSTIRRYGQHRARAMGRAAHFRSVVVLGGRLAAMNAREPAAAEAEVAEAGSALGRALATPLRDGRGWGSGFMTSSEALASIALEVSD